MVKKQIKITMVHLVSAALLASLSGVALGAGYKKLTSDSNKPAINIDQALQDSANARVEPAE